MDCSKEIIGLKKITLYVNDGIIFGFPDITQQQLVEVDLTAYEAGSIEIANINEQPKWERTVDYSANYKQNYSDKFYFILHGIKNNVPSIISEMRNNRKGYIAVIVTKDNDSYIFPTPVFVDTENTKKENSNSWNISITYRQPTFLDYYILLSTTLIVPPVFALNSLNSNDVIQGLDNFLTATTNISAIGTGFADLTFNWDFGTEIVTYSNSYYFVNGQIREITASAPMPNLVTGGSYTLTVSGSVSGSTTFNYIIPIIIETSITDYTTQTSGITLNFTGNVNGRWIDEPSRFNFISNSENTRNYTANGTYKLLVYGDILNIIEIIAEYSNITNINFVQLNQISYLNLRNNLFASLDLSKVPISTHFDVSYNSALTSITFASSGNGIITDFSAFLNTSLTSLDLSNVPVSGYFKAYGNTAMTSITFASSGNGVITNFNAFSNTSLTSLDLSNVPISTTFNADHNSALTSIIFASSGNGVITLFNVHDNANLAALNLSNVPVSGTFNAYRSPLISSMLFASSGNGVITLLNFTSNTSLAVLDLSNVPISSTFYAHTNSALTSIIFASSGNGIITSFYINNNILNGNIDFKGIELKTISLFKASSNPNFTGFSNYTYLTGSGNIYIDNCNFNQAEVDEWLQNAVNSADTNKVFDSSGGTNAAPSAAGLAYKDILVSRGWTVNYN